MKKNIALTIVFLAALAAAFIVSCKKEKQDINSKNGIVSGSTGEIDNMDDYLNLFRNKLNSASNSKETITLDQAQRDLGNLLNFDFGDANYPTNIYQKDTILINLPLVDGKVCLGDLAKTYQEARKGIIETFTNTDLPEKSILAIFCSIKQPLRDNPDAEVQLILLTRGVDPGLLIKISIDTTDNWLVGYEQGKCDGTCVGDDHATIIGKVFRNNRPPVDCVNGRLYYTDYQYGCFNGTEYPATGPGSEYCGYMLWVGTYDELGDCVEYPEMQYYYNNFCNIMDTILPSGHVFVSIECCVTCYLSVYERQYFFACFYEEAKPNCTNEPIH